MDSTPSIDFMLHLNEQAFTIPHALLAEAQRLHEKTVESDTKQLRAAFLALNSLMQNDQSIVGKESALASLDAVMQDVQAFEKKLKGSVAREGELLRRIGKRIEFYGKYEAARESGKTRSLTEWYLNYTNLLVADYLARNSKVSTLPENNADGGVALDPVNAGVVFLKQQEMQDLLDYDVLLAANKISRGLIDDNDLEPLESWIAKNKSALEKEGSSLEFYASFQRYVQALLNGNMTLAITVLQTTLFSHISTHFDEVTAACGMLVYAEKCVSSQDNAEETQNHTNDELSTPVDPTVLQQRQRENAFEYFFHRRMPIGPQYASSVRTASKQQHIHPTARDTALLVSNTKNLERYKELLSSKGWENLNNMFLKSYYSMYRIAKNEPLLIYISLGVSALKTRSCLHQAIEWDPRLDALCKNSRSKFGENKCPVCSEHFRRLAETLPFAHHTESKLFDNPVMLPSGNIYDSRRLKLLANVIRETGIMPLSEHEVLDPIDGDIYKLDDFVTMYPT